MSSPPPHHSITPPLNSQPLRLPYASLRVTLRVKSSKKAVTLGPYGFTAPAPWDRTLDFRFWTLKFHLLTAPPTPSDGSVDGSNLKKSPYSLGPDGLTAKTTPEGLSQYLTR